MQLYSEKTIADLVISSKQFAFEWICVMHVAVPCCSVCMCVCVCVTACVCTMLLFHLTGVPVWQCGGVPEGCPEGRGQQGGAQSADRCCRLEEEA